MTRTFTSIVRALRKFLKPWLKESAHYRRFIPSRAVKKKHSKVIHAIETAMEVIREETDCTYGHEESRWAGFLHGKALAWPDNTIPTVKDLQCAVSRMSMTDPELLEMTKRVEQHIKEQCGFFKRVRACYIPGKENSIVFIAFTDQPGQINICLPYAILVRKADEYNREGADMANYLQNSQNKITREGLKKLTATLQKYAKDLMDQHSNIQMLSASSVKSKDYGTGKAAIIPVTCIVIYVDVKGYIPTREKPLPTEIDGFPVDVREGGVHLFTGTGASEYHERLKMGCTISVGNKSGTLGAFVDDPITGEVCCITCAHPFLRSELSPDRDIDELEQCDFFQPTQSDRNRFGCSKRVIFKRGGNGNAGVDIALISITNGSRVPISGDFPADSTFETPVQYTSGKIFSPDEFPDNIFDRPALIKFGQKTGITIGSFMGCGASVRRRDDAMDYGFLLYGQMEVFPISNLEKHSFAGPGDSGSLVLTEHSDQEKGMELVAVGILVGGTSVNSYIVTPISDVLDTLGFPMQLKTFPSQGLGNHHVSLFQNLNLRAQTPSNDHLLSRIEELERKIDEKNRENDQKFDELGQKMDRRDGIFNQKFETICGDLESTKSGVEKILGLIENKLVK